MAIPNTPQNFLAQSGNNQIYLSWTPVVGAVSYNIQRSTNQITFQNIAAPTSAAYAYYDLTASTGTVYFYQVQAVNVSGVSSPSSVQAVTLVNSGQVSLGQVRLAAKQRSDMVTSNFVTDQEWNSYINHSYQELYDILVQVYADEYYYAPFFYFTTDNRNPALYPLPVDMYKLLGVDLALSAGNNGWLTLKKFPTIARNRYIYGNTPISYLGILDLRYRVEGANMEFVPNPASNQQVRLRYVPKPIILLADSDILDGISGWDEYVIVDAAIKALQKEESDVQVLMAQKQALRVRIESAASNRDAGEAECVGDVRRVDGGYWSGPMGDGPSGGF